MGIIQRAIKRHKKERAERKAYSQILTKKVKVAQRQEFEKASLIEAKKKAQRDAKAKYHPSTSQKKSGFGGIVRTGLENLASNIQPGSPFAPGQQKRIVKVKKVKRRRKAKPKYKMVRVRVK